MDFAKCPKNETDERKWYKLQSIANRQSQDKMLI